MPVSANPAVDLTTSSDAAAWLAAVNVTAPASDQLQQIITAMSASIQAWLGRNLISASYTQTYDGRGSNRLALPNSPITAVSSLTIDGVAIQAAANAYSYGYVVSNSQEPPPSPWVMLRGYRFCRGVQNVTISYTAGYQTAGLPAPIVQACREAVTALTQVAAREPGLIEEKVGGLEEKYVSPTDGATVQLDRYILTPTVTLALMPYRRVIPAG
jgi:hypothetical protein